MQKIKSLFLAAAVTLAAVVTIGFAGCAKKEQQNGLESKYSEQINTAAAGVKRELPFTRGVNFSRWFEADTNTLWYSAARYTEQDFIEAKAMGAEAIRLPIRMHGFTDSSAERTLDAAFLKLLDVAVGWAEKHEIYLILDNHSWSAEIPTAADIGDILIPVWEQIAARYKDRSNYIIYEILNEPWGTAINGIWSDVQGTVIDAIRDIDTKHTIMVTGANWGGISGMTELPKYDDDNLIYSFHFYGPYVFTHQGANWGTADAALIASMKNLPFPADAHEMPPLPNELKGTWLEYDYNHYAETATIAESEKELDAAVAFANEHNVPILCGEFGAHIPNIRNDDRVRWYQITTKLLEIRGIVRTSWDYYGTFGLFKTGNDNVAASSVDSDLNTDIVQALGFTPPPQIKKTPINKSFTIYDNAPNSRVVSFWANPESDIDFYYGDGGDYAMLWGDAAQYSSASFTFLREIEWASLSQSGYKIKLRVQADKNAKFQVRFLNNTAEGATGIPWRIIREIEITGGTEWQTIEIPLAGMAEWGAWLDGTGFIAPNEEFSWDNVDILQFAPENNDLHGVTVLFDSIAVVGDDTTDNDNGLPIGIIIGVIAGAAVAAIVSFIIYRLVSNKRKTN